MEFRRFVLVTHRWIGLGASIVLGIVGVTGAILVIPGMNPIRRLAGPMHERLWLGRPGWCVVVAATLAAVLLQLGGAILWWKRKRFLVRLDGGWRRALADLHHASGVIGFVVMMLLAGTGVLMAFVSPQDNEPLRRVIFRLHTTKGFSAPVKLVYLIGSAGFFVQALSGLVMWWPRQPARVAESDQGDNGRASATR